MVAVVAAKVSHGQTPVLTGQIGVEGLTGGNLRIQARSYRKFSRRGHNQFFTHVPDNLVKEQNHRSAVGFSQRKGLHGDAENILYRGSGQGNNGMVAMGTPAGLVYIALRNFGRQPRRRPAAHDRADHARGLGDASIAEGLLHQGKPRPGGSGQ